MKTATVTTVLSAPQPTVFAYLSDIEHLPEWATEFARELHRDGAGYRIVNGLGQFRFAIEADPRTGVIDMYAGPDTDRMSLFPTRAVALADGRTAYSFTMFQAPDMPDDVFDEQLASLRREFENIDRLLGGPPTA